MKIAVIDGLGGGLGSQIIQNFRRVLGDSAEILAFGTNSAATQKMLSQGAVQGATGENAIKQAARNVDIITGPLGIIIPNAMLGEITEPIAEAIAESPAKIFLIGNKQPHLELVGLKEQSLNDLINELTERVKEYVQP